MTHGPMGKLHGYVEALHGLNVVFTFFVLDLSGLVQTSPDNCWAILTSWTLQKVLKRLHVHGHSLCFSIGCSTPIYIYMYSIKCEYTIDANIINYQIFRFFSISVEKRTRFGDVRPGDPFEWTPDGIDPWFILPTSFWLLCSYKLCDVYKCLLHLLHVLTSILYIDLYINFFPNMHIQG